MVRIDMSFPPQHSFMFQSSHHEDHEHNQLIPSSNSLNTTLHPSYPQQHFNGGHTSFMMKRSVSFSAVDHLNDNQYLQCNEDQVHGGLGLGEDEFSDDGLPLGEKKKRLNLEQVKTLEKSFELGNKLEPERKIQLAKALGLQPRQIAIWFQNRRARWKTKQLEKDYDVLKKQFDALKADNDALHSHNNKLLAQLSTLKGRDLNEKGIINLKKEGDEGCWSNGSDNCSEINIDVSRTTPAINSPASSREINGNNLFPSTYLGPSTITQPLQPGSTRSDLQCLKVDHQQQINVQDGSFVCNMFNGIEEQQGFWAWPDQQHHFH